MKCLLLLAACVLLLPKVYSQAGKLDPSFGNGGYVSVLENFKNSYSEKATQVLQQGDGKLLVFIEGGTIARHNTNGSVDASWGIQGFQRVENGSGAFLPDGKIIIAGTDRLQRIQANGKPDSSFGNGSIILYPTTFYSNAYTVAVQPDGKIVIAGGHSPNNDARQFSVLRYNPNGTLDAGFGNGGQVITPTAYQYAQARYIAVKNDGKIVVAGEAFNSSSNTSYYLLVQYNANGTPDNSFGGSGIVQANLKGGDYGEAALTVLADGRIWLGGSGTLARYTATGNLETTLGTGFRSTRSIIVQPDGKIVAGGDVFISTNRYTGESDYDFAITRFQANGAQDNTFNGGGLRVGFSNYDFMTSMIIQPDGKLVAVGSTKQSPFYGFGDYVMTRINTNGTLDNSFDGDGKLIGSFPAYQSGLNTVIVQPDGKIITGGSGNVYRFNQNGSRDSLFSNGGKISFFTIDARSFALQADAKILYTGTYSEEALGRLKPDGSIDSSFGTNGFVKTPDLGYASHSTTILVQPDGKILAGAITYPASSSTAVAVLQRYNANGSPDNSFHGNGMVAFPFAGVINTITIQPDGKILAAGSTASSSGPYGFAIARYNPDGSPDNGFGAGGKASTAFGNYRSGATAIMLLPGGKLAVAGSGFTNDNNYDSYFGIAYFNADGTPDNNAGNGGKFVSSLALVYDINVVVEGGKFLVAGSFAGGSTTDVLITRLNANGSADSSFGSAGKIIADFGRTDLHPALARSGNRLYLAETNSLSTYEQTDASGILAAYLVTDSSTNPPMPPQPPANGLTYRFYQGVWTSLPNFNTLTPVKTGTTANVDISIRPTGVNTNYAFVWEGYINIPAPGDYTFETLSDDGSRIYFKTLYSPTATPLVDHDGEHYAYAKKGTIHIDSAGRYPVTITYFQKELDAVMKLYWTGPGIPRQPIPDAAFTNNYQPPSTSGLQYRFYQGSWTSLPNFSTLTPVKTGSTPNVDINVRPAGVNTNYAFVWEGYINIPAAGDYTFETFSDDGSRFYFNSFYAPAATALVDHDGEHYAYAKKGTIHIDAAGLYPVAITYFQKELDAAMQLYWTGPGIARQRIPDAAFTNNYQPPVAGGLRYRFYQGVWTSLPNFKTLTPVKTGTTPNINLNPRPAGVNTNYAFLWEGYINIKTPGDYTFETFSDDGSRIYFNTLYSPTATPLVDHDGEHYAYAKKATIHISAPGLYPIAVTYFQKELDAVMQLYWTAPGISRQPVPDSVFVYYTGSPSSSAAVTAGWQPHATAADNSSQPESRLYPNPFTDKLNVEINNPVQQATISVELFDAAGKKVYSQNFKNMPSGQTNLKLAVPANLYPASLYHAQVRVNGVVVGSVKLMKAVK